MLETLPPLKPGMTILVGASTWMDRLVGHATYPICGTGPYGVRYTHALKVKTPEKAVEAQVDKNRVAETDLDGRLYRWYQKGIPVLIRDYREPISDVDRELISDVCAAFEGRKYDYVQCAVYALTGRFILDGPKRVVCSRLCTAVDEIALDVPELLATAADLSVHRRFVDVWRSPWA